jgi:hypothetical protein
MSASRPFAIVTSAATSIGFELANRCTKEGYDPDRGKNLRSRKRRLPFVAAAVICGRPKRRE